LHYRALAFPTSPRPSPCRRFLFFSLPVGTLTVVRRSSISPRRCCPCGPSVLDLFFPFFCFVSDEQLSFPSPAPVDCRPTRTPLFFKQDPFSTSCLFFVQSFFVWVFFFFFFFLGFGGASSCPGPVLPSSDYHYTRPSFPSFCGPGFLRRLRRSQNAILLSETFATQPSSTLSFSLIFSVFSLFFFPCFLPLRAYIFGFAPIYFPVHPLHRNGAVFSLVYFTADLLPILLVA